MEQNEFHIFYEKTAVRLRAYIARSSGSMDFADDILQEAYIRFLRVASLPADDTSRRAYLYRIADSLIIENFRRLRRENKGLLGSLLNNEVPDHDLGHDVRRAFSELKPQQRSLLWLAYVEGLNHQEIAAATGIKESSVRVLLFRARKALLGILNRFGLGPEIA